MSDRMMLTGSVFGSDVHKKRRSSDENRLFLTVLFNLRVLITQR
mgnify:CR=1 FL=1